MAHTTPNFVSVCLIALLVAVGSAHAHSLREQMVGTWTLVSDTALPSAKGPMSPVLVWSRAK